MIAKANGAIESENESLRRQVKRLKEQLKKKQQEIVELQGKRDALRWMVDNPITPEEIEEYECLGKDINEALEHSKKFKDPEQAFRETLDYLSRKRGEKFYTGEEVLAEMEEMVKKAAWKKKRTSKSRNHKQ